MLISLSADDTRATLFGISLRGGLHELGNGLLKVLRIALIVRAGSRGGSFAS